VNVNSLVVKVKDKIIHNLLKINVPTFMNLFVYTIPPRIVLILMLISYHMIIIVNSQKPYLIILLLISFIMVLVNSLIVVKFLVGYYHKTLMIGQLIVSKLKMVNVIQEYHKKLIIILVK